MPEKGKGHPRWLRGLDTSCSLKHCRIYYDVVSISVPGPAVRGAPDIDAVNEKAGEAWGAVAGHDVEHPR